MPGSSTTPGRPGTRAHVPVRIAFHLRNSVGTRDMNLYEAQWLACMLPCRRFVAALTDGHARLGADVDRYSVITSDLHRLLVAGLPAHCERFCTSSNELRQRADRSRQDKALKKKATRLSGGLSSFLEVRRVLVSSRRGP
jgi:hypothetical protein